MLETIITIAICATCICAIGAAWDAARRYIDMRRFNQAALDEMARIDGDHEELKRKLQAVNDKITAQAAVGGFGRVGTRARS